MEENPSRKEVTRGKNNSNSIVKAKLCYFTSSYYISGNTAVSAYVNDKKNPFKFLETSYCSSLDVYYNYSSIRLSFLMVQMICYLYSGVISL